MKIDIKKAFGLILAVVGLIVQEPPSAHADCATATIGAKPTGYVFHNADYDVLQVCRSDGTWQAISPIGCPAGDGCDPCAGSPSPGDVCADGSVYAGLSPDGNVPMYIAAADAPGGEVNAWNNGNSGGIVTTNQTSTVTGDTNTTNLIGIDSDSNTGGTQPHQAAQYCADLSAHGHTDWYLPALNELSLFWNGGSPIAGINATGYYYWSSTENDNLTARSFRFDGFGAGTHFKYIDDLLVRCVRR